MRLLISAYACAPDHGSEHGVGWNWTTEARRLGHDVWALVSPAHRGAIEKASRDDPHVAGIHWAFPELGYWPLDPATEPKWERTYNLLWQRAALAVARELHAKIGFEAIHHLTWGGIRAPTFLGSVGPPLIIGPVGGGETSPPSLRDGLGLRGKLLERLRDLSNSTIGINPLVRGGLAKAAIIFAKTSDTRDLLDAAIGRNAELFIELGVQKAQIGAPRPLRRTPPRLLYAGRLLYWKGVHIAVQAFAQILQQMPQARLTIVGSGSEESRLRSDVLFHKINDHVDFIGRLPQPRLFELYDSHDLLLFPSLHDSSGGVVLEALCRGLPVVCLDLGGPKDIVTPNSGVVVETTGLNTSRTASRIAVEVCKLLESPMTLAELSAGAIARANEFILTDRVAKFYRAASSLVGSDESGRVGAVAGDQSVLAVAGKIDDFARGR